MPNDEEPEIRIAAYTGALFEGPCMRQGCINRLRRIVELEARVRELEADLSRRNDAMATLTRLEERTASLAALIRARGEK